MNARAAKASAKKSSGSFRAYFALAALIAGLALGALAGAPRAVEVASFIGALWLNALKMTVIPLVVTLLVVGIAKSSEAAAAGRIAGRSVLWMVIICTVSAAFGAVAIIVLTKLFPLARSTASGLKTALSGSSTAFQDATTFRSSSRSSPYSFARRIFMASALFLCWLFSCWQ